MLLVVGGIKGGSGKTTIATNLAVLCSLTSKVLLVDADEQKSAWDWAQQRDAADKNLLRGFFTTVCMSGKGVYSNLQRLQQDYDHIIVDTGGRDTTSQRSALCIADKVLLPFKPSSIDIWTVAAIKTILDECVNDTLRPYAVISQADANGRDNEEAAAILRDFKSIETLECTIGNRKAFRNAASEGLGVKEILMRDSKALDEMMALYNKLYS